MCGCGSQFASICIVGTAVLDTKLFTQLRISTNCSSSITIYLSLHQVTPTRDALAGPMTHTITPNLQCAFGRLERQLVVFLP